MTQSAYRADIDGLRAIAVLAVVAFHAFPTQFPGGFIGVDIFFVISGYLITNIIISELQRDSFDFTGFYSRRVRRIFPALILVLGACYLIGWNSLFRIELKELSKHIAGAAAFSSNILLWSESGYFDTAAETKPLLHLWSLGIEEQFYLLWPLILWLAWKSGLDILKVTIALLLASFALNVARIDVDPVSTFYLPQSRIWELLIGSLLAQTKHFGPSRLRQVQHLAPSYLAWSGAALLAGSFAVMNKDRAFPGWWAALPTLGAALIIWAGPHAWPNRVILSTRLLVWFGLISFSLYLWHWPLLTFAKVLQGSTPTPQVRGLAVLLAVVLAWLTFKFVERPFRRTRSQNRPTAMLLVSMLVVGILGVLSFSQERTSGLPRGFAALNPLDGTGFDGGDGGFAVKGCGVKDSVRAATFGACMSDTRQRPTYALMGDSKAASVYAGLVRTSTDQGRWMIIGGNGPNGAPVPVMTSRGTYGPHEIVASIAVEELAKNSEIKVVALMTATRALFQLERIDSIEGLPASKYYDAAFEGLSAVVNKLVTAGKKVVFIMDSPSFPDPTLCMNRVTTLAPINLWILQSSKPRCSIAIDKHLELSTQYRRLLSEVQKAHPEDFVVFDTTEDLCDIAGGVCLPYKQGRLLYSYTDHLSDYAAGVIGTRLNKFLVSH